MPSKIAGQNVSVWRPGSQTGGCRATTYRLIRIDAKRENSRAKAARMLENAWVRPRRLELHDGSGPRDLIRFGDENFFRLEFAVGNTRERGLSRRKERSRTYMQATSGNIHYLCSDNKIQLISESSNDCGTHTFHVQHKSTLLSRLTDALTIIRLFRCMSWVMP